MNNKEKKRYYWIKLNLNFFQQDKIDYLMSQKDGANYIVLYQMLCLKTANNGGSLSNNIGDIIVPYDIDKIVRDCRYFSKDTVMVAMELYRKLGLIYQEHNQVLQIADFADLVGYESISASRVRRYRKKTKALQCNKNVTKSALQCNKNVTKSALQCNKNVTKSALQCNEETETEIEIETEVDSNEPTKSVSLLDTLEILKSKLDEVRHLCWDTLDDGAYNRLYNLFSKISVEAKSLTIGDISIKPEVVLQGMIDLFRREEKESANLILECWHIVDTTLGVKNKYKYAISVFYNRAQGL